MVQMTCEIIKKIGCGGMADVYLVETLDKRKMALKVAKSLNSNEKEAIFQKSLVQEMHFLMELNHPMIPTFIKVSKDQCGYFMEYVEGVSLNKLLSSKKIIMKNKLIRWMLQIIDVLSYMHECGVLYLDMKPQNLILDKQGDLHLIDFGSCQYIEKRLNLMISCTPRILRTGGI